MAEDAGLLIVHKCRLTRSAFVHIARCVCAVMVALWLDSCAGVSRVLVHASVCIAFPPRDRNRAADGWEFFGNDANTSDENTQPYTRGEWVECGLAVLANYCWFSGWFSGSR